MKFCLSGNLIRYTDYEREIDVQATTVHEGIHSLVERYPSLCPVLLDGEKQVRRLHRIFVNGELMEPEALDAPVSADADVSILTAIAGG